jgi:D-3-phosphoglycerate dehydrogenase
MPRVSVLERIHDDGIARLRDFAELECAWGLGREGHLRLVMTSDAVIVKGSTKVDDEFLATGDRLRIVARAGTGLDNIDIAAAAKRGITVFNVPTGNSRSAAEFTVLSMLRLARRIDLAASMKQAGDFRRHLLEGRELGALCVGLVGFGNVGRLVAELLCGFGSKVVAFDPGPVLQDEFDRRGVRRAPSLEALASQIDILSLHATFDARNPFVVGDRIFACLKPGAFVVNTARGQLLDQAALIRALDAGTVAAAALDLIDPEPPFDLVPDAHHFDHALLRHPKVVVTPHMAASTIDAQGRIAIELVDRLGRCLGLPR